jgi:CheY-like chemotaxis protein
MKILVADDEPTVRRIMQAFLEKNRYEVVTVDGGEQALAALAAEDGPKIAIIDWMMPELNGLEVCAKLRQIKLRIQPYLFILTSKNGERDLAASLDAGADDFLTKPFRPAEMLARLRVAERTIACATETQERIEELEMLVDRYKVLGEMVARPAQPAVPAVAGAEQSAVLLPEEIETQTVHAWRELGVEAVATRRERGGVRPYRSAYAAWAGLVLADRERWTDLLLEAEPLSVSTVFSRALQRPPTAAHSQSFMVEALTIISSSLGATLMNRGIEVLMPYLAQGLRVDRDDKPIPVPGAAETYFFELAGAEFALTVMDHLCPVQRELVRTMRSYDILAENFPPTENPGVALFKQGTVLNEHYIEKMIAYTETSDDRRPVKVFKATPLTRHFQRKGGGR